MIKNKSNNDIIINDEFLPYEEKIFMCWPKEINTTNNKKIILKKNSIIFFEFKALFPQNNWKDKFNGHLRKIRRFLDIYQKRGLYNQENIQIYLIYYNIPDIYFIEEIKTYMNRQNLAFFSTYEIGIYYFTSGKNLINNTII